MKAKSVLLILALSLSLSAQDRFGVLVQSNFGGVLRRWDRGTRR